MRDAHAVDGALKFGATPTPQVRLGRDRGGNDWGCAAARRVEQRGIGPQAGDVQRLAARDAVDR